MSDLLREYVLCHLNSQLTEAVTKSGDLNLLSNQNLGYAAEWAVFEAIGGKETLFKGKEPSDGRLVRPWSMASEKGRGVFKKVYKLLVRSAMDSLSESETFKEKLPSAAKEIPPGAGTRPVDVTSDIADIHVKYNDAARLAGFQRARTEKEEYLDPVTKKMLKTMKEIPSSKTAQVFDTGMSQFIDEIIEDVNTSSSQRKQFGSYVTGGLLRKPTSLSSKDKSKESLSNWAKFEKAKTTYQDAVQRVGRERLLQIFSDLGMEKAILSDIAAQLFGAGGKAGSNKKTVFAKFFAPRFDSEQDIDGFNSREYASGLRCHFLDYKQIMGLSNPLRQLKVYTVPAKGFERAKEQLAIAAMKEDENLPMRKSFSVGGLSTVFYLVTGVGDKSDNIYFKIEFRLDGEGHPPQLKVGPDLDQL